MTNRNLILLFVLMSMLSGACLPLIKDSYTNIPPIYFLTLRFGLAFLIILAYLRGRFLKGITRETIFPLLFISVFLTGGYVAYNLSMVFTTSTNANFLANTSIVMIPFLAKAVNKTRYTKQLFVGIFIMLVGVFGLVHKSSDFTFNPGDIMALFAAFIFSVQIVLVGKYINRLEPVTLAGFEFGFTALVALVLATIFEDIPSFGELVPMNWVAVITVAVFSTVAMFVMQNFAQRRLSESVTGIIIALMPLFTAISAAFILGEHLTIIGKIGGVLMVTGSIVASTHGNRINNEEELIRDGNFGVGEECK